MVIDPIKRTVLFVDDRAKRIDWAIRQYYENSNLIIAPNVPEALRAISSVKWKCGDIISLDHDLNGHDFQDVLDMDCGMQIVRYMKFSGFRFPAHILPSFYVHTSNKLAAKLMMEDLEMMDMAPIYKPIDYEES